MKRTVRMMLSLMVSIAMLAGAMPVALAAQYTPGDYTATAKGFGGDITVVITVDETAITHVAIAGEGETAGIGTNAIEQLPALIVEAQSTDIDAIAGATVSSSAILLAATSALNEASGAQVASAALTDGTYTATAPSYAEQYGLATTGSLTLTMEVSGQAIEGISVDEFTDIIGGMAFPLLAEQVIAHQSLNIDAISGATVSSNGFLAALGDCITQAGGDAAAYKMAPVPVAEASAQQIETEVLVIGAGMAGLTAAIEAAEGGADVILLEKNSVYSSSLTRSLGYILGADTEAQKAAGIEDTE